MYYEWSDELYHHGIKGMHWGIRRFQNEDGTLTEAGRQRYLNQAKLDSTNSGKLSAGHVFYRVANSGEGIDNRQKYVTDRQDDFEKYANNADNIDTDMSRSVSAYAYAGTKEMYVARAKEVAAEIMDAFGDRKLSEVPVKGKNEYTETILKSMGNLKISEIIKHYNPDSTVFTAKDVKKHPEKKLEYTVNMLMTQIADYALKNNTEVLERLYAKGYDVVEDLCDKGVYSKNPLIVINPAETLKLLGEISLDDMY